MIQFSVGKEVCYFVMNVSFYGGGVKCVHLFKALKSHKKLGIYRGNFGYILPYIKIQKKYFCFHKKIYIYIYIYLSIMFQIGLTVLINFNSINHYATKNQTNLNNIMANHQLQFQLDVSTCHEGIKVLLEKLLTLRYIPSIFNSHIS